MATLHEQTVRYNEIRAKIDSEVLPKDELMALLREGRDLADDLGFTSSSRELKDRLQWLMKSHEAQRNEISPYWQPE